MALTTDHLQQCADWFAETEAKSLGSFPSDFGVIINESELNRVFRIESSDLIDFGVEFMRDYHSVSAIPESYDPDDLVAGQWTVTDPMMDGETFEGTYRHARLRVYRQVENGTEYFYVIQTLRKGWITSVDNKGAVDWSEFRIINSEYFHANRSMPVLRLRGVAATAVHDICEYLNQDSFTDILCFNDTLEGTWYRTKIETDMEEDGSYRIDIKLADTNNTDLYYLYYAAPDVIRGHYFKWETTETAVEEMVSSKWFNDSTGVLHEGAGDPGSGYSTLQDGLAGRTIQQYRFVRDEDDRLFDLEIIITWTLGDSSLSRLSGDGRVEVAASKTRVVFIEKAYSVPESDLETLRAFYDDQPDTAGVSKTIEVERKADGTYDVVGIISTESGFYTSASIGERVVHIGWHVALPPSTSDTAPTSAYTRITISGAVISESVEPHEDGTYSWRIIEQSSSSSGGPSNPGEISGNSPIVSYGEPLVVERFVKKVQSITLPSELDLIGRYEDVSVDGDVISSSTIPDTLTISGTGTSADAEWELYPDLDSNGYLQWTLPSPHDDLGRNRIYRDPTRGYKWTLKYDTTNTWYNPSTDITGVYPLSGTWYKSDSGYDAPGDITISGTGTDADDTWTYGGFDENGYPYWVLGEGDNRLYRDPVRSYKWTLKWNASVLWYNETVTTDYYPPTTGWSAYAGTGYRDIRIFGIGGKADADQGTVWKYWEAYDFDPDNPGVWVPFTEDGKRIYPADGYSHTGWNILNFKSGGWCVNMYEGATYAIINWFDHTADAYYPPKLIEDVWINGQSRYATVIFSYEGAEYTGDFHEGYPAPTLTLPDPLPFDPDPGDVVEITAAAASGMRSGRRLVKTRVRNADVVDGKFSYELYEIVVTAPINTDDGWYQTGHTVRSEVDEPKFKSYTRTQVDHTQAPAEALHHVNIWSAPRWREIAEVRSRKYFVREPTNADLAAAGNLPLTPTSLGSDLDADVSYVHGKLSQSGHTIYFVERVEVTKGQWQSDPLTTLNLEQTPVVYKQHQTNPGPPA